MDQIVTPATYTVEEVAKILGIGRNSAYEAVRSGQIPSLRIGKRLLVSRIVLDSLLRLSHGRPAGGHCSSR